MSPIVSEMVPVAVTPLGRLRGRYRTLSSDAGDMAGQRVATWRGVSYGQTTAGEYRFYPPRPVEPWEGVKEADKYRPPALQPGTILTSATSMNTKVIGTEDCLHLDIVRPATRQVLPVVVYFHGGSFVTGASHEKVLRGHNFASRMDVVYVSVNFRLGVLGYLDLQELADDSEVSANPAVLDQVLALEWVQDNILAFGGDPSNVTVMGESAGANAVVTLMTVPRAQGLFHQAIAQSPPVASVHTEVQSTMWTRLLAESLGIDASNSAEAFRSVPARDLVLAAQGLTFSWTEGTYLNATFSPTVDGEVLPEHPITAFRQGRQQPVPLIIGTNLDEVSFSKFIYQRQKRRSEVAGRVASVFDPESAEAVLHAYNQGAGREEFAQLFADAVFWAPSLQVAEAHADIAPTWMYRFDFAPQALRWLGLGAIHSLDLAAVFGDPKAHRATSMTKFAGLKGLKSTSESMQRMWKGFIHRGQTPYVWPTYETEQSAPRMHDRDLRATMVFDEESRVEFDP